MSQPNHDGAHLIRTLGVEQAEQEALSRWLASENDEYPSYTAWCAAVLAYVKGYRDGANHAKTD